MASVTFSTSLGGNGQTITDDADPNTGLAAGGHRVRFISALSGAVDMAATSVAKAQEAENFKNLCQQLRDEAETFKNQASTSENNAAESATLSEDWATKLSTPVDGVEYSSKYYANEASVSASDAATSAASVDANNIVHAPGSGLLNEAGTAYAADVTTSATDTTAGRVITTDAGPAQAYKRANILGPVSQSGGVPTGAWIERVSNANGEYVKFADGTLICRLNNLVLEYTSPVNLRKEWTYPHPFEPLTGGVSVSYTIPVGVDITAAARRNAFVDCANSSPRSSSVFMRIIDDDGGYVNTDTCRMIVTAIGRWY